MKVLRLNRKVAELKHDKSSCWVYIRSSSSELERRIFAPNHHYFRQVLKVLLWNKLIWCGEEEYKDIDLFQVPKGAK